MRAAPTSAILRFETAVQRIGVRTRMARLGGLAIASLVPALFWSAMMALAASWLHAPISTFTIAIVGGAIALFLAAVCAPIVWRDPA